MRTQKLKVTLLANAGFSTISGLTMILANSTLSQWMGITPTWILPSIGLGLMLFAIHLYRTASKATIAKGQIRLIIWQDWLWVLASLIVIVTQAFDLKSSAYLLIGGIAIIVADFALLQQWYLGKQTSA
ncbi:MAG: hypothetical protein KTR30_24565 [Saprospiraceae bacterium]|nr:hypothetical protein [Saprospiraceae bacterium]